MVQELRGKVSLAVLVVITLVVVVVVPHKLVTTAPLPVLGVLAVTVFLRQSQVQQSHALVEVVAWGQELLALVVPVAVAAERPAPAVVSQAQLTLVEEVAAVVLALLVV